MMFPMNWLFLSLFFSFIMHFSNKKIMNSFDTENLYKNQHYCCYFTMKWKW